MKGSFLFVRLVFWSISLIYQDSQIRKYLFWLIFRFCNGKHRIKNKIWCEYTNIEVNLQLPFNIIIKSLRYDISKLMIQKWRRNKVLIWENYWKTKWETQELKVLTTITQIKCFQKHSLVFKKISLLWKIINFWNWTK